MDANEALLRPVNGGFHGTSKESQGLERITMKGSWCKKQSRWSIGGCHQENENCRSTESQTVLNSAEKRPLALYFIPKCEPSCKI